MPAYAPISPEAVATLAALFERTAKLDAMPQCGDSTLGPPTVRECEHVATRLSHVYEGLSVYVCDIDHEGLEPRTAEDIEDLPDAQMARDANRCRDANAQEVLAHDD